MVWGIARTGALALVLVCTASTASFAGGCRGDWTGRTWAQWYDDCSRSVSEGYDSIQELRAWPRAKWEAYQQQQRDDAARIQQQNLRDQQAIQQNRQDADKWILEMERDCKTGRYCSPDAPKIIDDYRQRHPDLPQQFGGATGGQQPAGGGVGGIRLNVEAKRVEPNQDMTDIRNQVLNLRQPSGPPKARGMLDD